MTIHNEIRNLLVKLNDISVDTDQYAYGIPIHNEDAFEKLQRVMLDFIDKLPQQNKNIIEIDCFEVYEIDVYNAYKRVHVAYVTTIALAMNLCYGNNYRGYAPYKKSYKIFDSIGKVKQNELRSKIKNIKAKLSQEELELLGLI